jgi:hypothetical protein
MHFYDIVEISHAFLRYHQDIICHFKISLRSHMFFWWFYWDIFFLNYLFYMFFWYQKWYHMHFEDIMKISQGIFWTISLRHHMPFYGIIKNNMFFFFETKSSKYHMPFYDILKSLYHVHFYNIRKKSHAFLEYH